MATSSTEKLVSFVAGEAGSGAHDVSHMDSDLYSWMIMNSDMFPAHATSSPSLHPMSAPPPGVLRAMGGEVDFKSEPVPFLGESASSAASASLSPTPEAEEEGGGAARGDSSSPAASGAAAGGAGLDPNEEGISAEEKRRRKLEKNREIARNCRKRKRERMSALEGEVERLRNWNRQLRLMLNKDNSEGKAIEEKRLREVQDFREMTSRAATTDTEFSRKLAKYKEVYSDFGKERKAAVDFHIQQLKSLLLPTQVSKMTMWSLQQEDEFYDERRNTETFGGGIWNMICKELELTVEQKKKLIEQRHNIRSQRKNVGQCLRIVNELEELSTGNIEKMHGQMDELMSIISPRQQVKFLLWIENNQACVHMLQPLFTPHPTTGGETVTDEDDSWANESASRTGGSDSGGSGAGAASGAR